MAVPSSPGWKFGYVPSPGEWNNTFAGKVDFPAPLGQGGTGGQDALSGNYNLQQRAQIITATANAAPLTFYSVRSDLSAIVITIPLASACKAGDWIDIFDAGANAGTNNITLLASGSDVILYNATSGSSLILQNNGARCILATDGVGTWSAQIVTQSTGIGFAASSVRTLTASTTIDPSYVGALCKVSGAAVTLTLAGSGFVQGNAVAIDNIDGTNTISLSAASGDYPPTLPPNATCIIVADGAGGWWRAAFTKPETGAFSPTPIQISGTTYTLQLGDAGQYLQFTSAAAVTVTVPLNATVAFALGAVIVIEQYGAGQVTLVGDSGVTLNARNGLKTAGQYAVAQIKSGSNNSADTWTVLGDTAS